MILTAPINEIPPNPNSSMILNPTINDPPPNCQSTTNNKLAFLSKYAVNASSNATLNPHTNFNNISNTISNPPSNPIFSNKPPPPPINTNNLTNNYPNNKTNNIPPNRNSEYNSIKPLQKNYEIADVIKWTQEPFPWDQDISDLRRNVFGLPNFRPNQKAIVNATLSKKDVFVCMPTGAGKSLCFQLPALKDQGVTLVIMPLISLIFDQINQLKSLGIEAIGLAGQSQLSYQELKGLFHERSDLKLVFSTPEKLEKCPWFLDFLKQMNNNQRLSRIVIDEAHCVSHWGRDFRPDYLLLGRLRMNFPEVPIMALTATATELVRKDVIQNLSILNCLYFQSSFNRPNLFYEIRNKFADEKTIENIKEFIMQFYPKKSGIIYCTTIKEAEKVAMILKETYGLSCAAYHASLPENTRKQLQEDWMIDEVLIVVATIAFGMGINKPNVRFVIHFSLAKSIENFYQESGRAGRDGKVSHCLVYYRFKDRLNHYFLMNVNKGGSKDGKRGLLKMLEFLEDKTECRRESQLKYFGEKFNRMKCEKMCDNCLNERKVEERDFFPEFRKIEGFLKGLNDKKITYTQMVKMLAGKNSKKGQIFNENSGPFGILKHLSLETIETLIKNLLFREVLYEKTFEMFGHSISYVHFNKSLISQDLKVPILVNNSPLHKSKCKRKPNEGPLPINIEPNESQSNIFNHLEKFIFRKSELPPPNKASKDHPPDRTPLKKQYDKECGFCTEDQYEEILARLILTRKQIFKKNQNNPQEVFNNIDDVFPMVGLEEMSRKLPTTPEELNINNIKNVGLKPLQQYGKFFLQEIEYFLRINNIDKTEFEAYNENSMETNKKIEVFDYKHNCLPLSQTANKETNEALQENNGIPEDEEDLYDKIDEMLNFLQE